MTGAERPLLAGSGIAKASAALLIVSTTIPAPDDRRAHLIREMANLGMDDDNAVEFLALVVMPLDLLEDTRSFLAAYKMPISHLTPALRRQRFFRFANDMFCEHLRNDAVMAVRNGMKIAPESAGRFVEYMTERVAYLRESHGIDVAKELTEEQTLAAQALLALMNEPLHALNGSDEYGIIKDSELASLTIEVGDRYPEMIRHIEERRSLDTELLRDLMRSSAPAVSEGIL